MLAFVGIVYKSVEMLLDRSGIAKFERDGPFLQHTAHTKMVGSMHAVSAAMAFSHAGHHHGGHGNGKGKAGVHKRRAHAPQVVHRRVKAPVAGPRYYERQAMERENAGGGGGSVMMANPMHG